MVQDATEEFKQAAALRKAEWAARAGFALRSHVLERAAGALGGADLTQAVAVVKGGALALEGYEVPWSRQMEDLDLLVRADRRDEVLRVLEAEGFSQPVRPGRGQSRAFFGETVLTYREGPLSFSVEVHTALDRLADRPIDYAALFGRAHELPGLAPLLAPEPLDHLLLVALHLANHEFWHEHGWADLQLLLSRACDERGPAEVARLLGERAEAWKLQTVLALCLGALRARGGRVPGELRSLERLGPVRRLALLPFYRPGAREVPRFPMQLGWTWPVFQAPLREDLLPWAARLGRFWATRVAERARAR